MLLRLPAYFDVIPSLPLPLLIAVLVLYWGGLALVIHRWLVPWITGRDGIRIGRLEAEVPAQVGLAFGLLVSFITMSVWEQHSRAADAARTEAAAYREMVESLEDSPPERSLAVRVAVHDSVAFILGTEWPKLAHLASPRMAAPPLRSLRSAIQSLPDGSQHDELHDLYRQAAAARETRLRIAADRPPPARWGIVGVLAILTLVGVGLIHAECRRARRIAVGMVAVGIASCFVILFAYTRPYLGQFAVAPDELRMLLSDMQTAELPAAQTRR